ncbi:hypothetical protein [Photobacterium salinisoli]|uniref:hypothetical protein n=1 Tax=Photobacterium salinisoli TaxID=1616783 RepID=UPI000EA393C0|nr:hypothetical protein [Photobacterium salinisoli]
MKKLLFIFILAFSSSTHAKWQYYVQPVELLYEGDNSGSRAYIVFKDKLPLADCGDQDGGYIRIYGDTQKGQYFISTLLAAITANKKVFPALAGCDDWGRPVLTGLRIRAGI